MEGAPEFKQQPNGPFVWRKWYNLLVVAVNSLLKMEVKGGGKFVYGENKVILDLTGNNGGGTKIRIAVIKVEDGPIYTNAVIEVTAKEIF
jgi:hypothetical protein